MNNDKKELIDSYLRTKYVVYNFNLTIKIGTSLPQLDELIKINNVSTWAYITAYNPFSKLLPEEENIKKHQELIKEVRKYKIYEGEGIGEDSSWKPERSLLIFGISYDDAIKLGMKFKQNAIVFGTLNSPAELIILEV